MIGFFGSRRVVDLKDGRYQQRIECRTQQDIDFWKSVYPDGEKFRAVMVAPMCLRLNATKPQTLLFQDGLEKQQFLQTFPPSDLFEHVARWETPNLLVIGCKAVEKPATTAPEAVSIEEKWRQLNDAKLRTEAAKIGVPNIDPKEGREMLIARMKRHTREESK